MTRIDAFLTGMAAKHFPGALVSEVVVKGVYDEDDGKSSYWILERPNKDSVGLGREFKVARRALEQFISSEVLKNTDKI